MAQPPSFYAPPATTGRLPTPGNPNAGITEGVDAIARAVGQADADTHATDSRVRETQLQVDRIEHERALQVATGDAAAKIATMQGQLGVDLIELRQSAEPGGAGHEDKVAERLNRFHDEASALLGGNPELVGRFVDNIASIGATARVGEAKWVAEQRALKTGDDYEALDNVVGSNIRTAVINGTATDQTLVNTSALRARAIDALPVPGTVKDQMKREGWVKDNVTAMQAWIDRDPHIALAMIDKGALKMAPDKTVDQLRESARVAADRLDGKATQKANEQAGVIRAQARNAIEDVNKGVLIPTETLQAQLAAVEGSKLPEDISLAHDLTIALAKNGVTAKYDDAPLDERRKALAEIETTKDWRKNAQLVTAHEQLLTLINRDDAAALDDPLNLYRRQTGQDVGEAKLTDPAAMGRRFIAADRAYDRFGRKGVPQVFTKEEAAQYRSEYNAATTDGKAGFLLNLGAYGGTRARQMIAQIAPGKPELIRLAEMAASQDPAVKSIVREAADGSAAPARQGLAAQVQGVMQRDFGPALSRLPGDRQRAVLTVATWVAAHRAAASGKADSVSNDVISGAISAALGSANGKGGMGRRNGGAFVLPMGVTQEDFDRVLAMGTVHNDAVAKAANGFPHWNGRVLTKGEFAGLVPVLINDTGTQSLYAFRSKGGSGFVKNEKGEDYVIDMRRLGANLKSSISPENLARYGYVRR